MLCTAICVYCECGSEISVQESQRQDMVDCLVRLICLSSAIPATPTFLVYVCIEGQIVGRDAGVQNRYKMATQHVDLIYAGSIAILEERHLLHL